MMHRSDRGSTLIELLISLSILGVILVIIMGAFRIGIRAWETGDRDVDSSQRQQMAFSILKRQISSVCNQSISMEDEKPFVFRGDAGAVDFISTVSVVPGNEAGNVRVTYRVGSDEENGGTYLEITEQVWLNQSDDKNGKSADESLAYRLLSGAHAILFEYLKITPESSGWQTEWNPENEDGFPAAVRCIVQMDEEKPPITVVARILPEADNR